MRKNYETDSHNLYFTNENLESFSFASHDRSPLHMDDAYAEKTVYARRLLFGFLGSLACLGKLKKEPNKNLSQVEIEYRNPMFTELNYELNFVPSNRDKVLIEVTDKEKTFISIRSNYNEKNLEKNTPPNNYDNNINKDINYIKTIQKDSLDYSEEELVKGVEKYGEYYTDKIYVDKLSKQFFSNDSTVMPIHIDSLMMCSYIAGMILPGRRSLCMKLNMSFYEVENYTHDKLEYKVSSISYDKQFNLLGIDIKIYHLGKLVSQGELHVCVRKEEWLTNEEEVKPDNKSERIAIASTFTCEPLLSSLTFWKKELDIPIDIKFAPYNQVFQELLNPNSLLANNDSGMNVILLRFGDWLRYKNNNKNTIEKITQEDIEFLNTNLNNLISSLQTFSNQSSTSTLLLLCPFSTNDINNNIFKQLENKLMEEIKDINSINIVNVADYQNIYNINEIYDAMRDKMGHVPYTNEYYNMLGTVISRRLYGLKNKPYKVIVLDCDNTLWNGVCGEVGPNGVNIDGPLIELHKLLIQQTEGGKLLCLCSKNVEEDVWKVFNENSNMLLSKDHITNSKINWKPKSENIKELAKTLNLGLDSFIFIDDNPIECAEVRANCPEVFTIKWPEEDEKKRKLLNHFWILDQYSITEEDKARTQMYKANVARSELEESSNDYDDFLKSLDLNIEISDMTDNTLARVSQLTERTNQFNFTTIRRKPNEIVKLVEGSNKCLTVKVEDRFGSYGLVGVMIIKEENEELIVDTFLLSCRVLGRGVEYEMVSKLGKIAKKRNLKNVKILFNKTAKNLPANNFLDDIGKEYKKEISENEIVYLIPAEELSKVTFNTRKYSNNKASNNKTKLASIDSSAREKEKMIERIYKELSNIMDLTKEINKSLIEGDNTTSDINSKEENKSFVSNNNLQQKVLEELETIFSKHLDIPYESINGEDELEGFHIDSFKIMDIMVALGSEYNDIPSTLLFEHRNLKSIAEYLIQNYRQILEEKYPNKEITYNNQQDIISEEKVEVNNTSILNNLGEDIAIIGINGLYPNAKTIPEFWDLLLNGETAIKEIPEDRWNLDLLYDPSGNKFDKAYSKWGAFIKDIDKFEPTFFNISPKEAELIDPQQRLFLQVVWGLLEDAGYTSENIDRNTGVFAAVVASDYGTFLDQASLKGVSAYRDTDFYQIPNRISYFFDFNGPSIAVNTACSGSGTAIHLAYESLKRGECNTAVVGGINLFIHPSRWVQYSRIHFHSPDGICRPFGKGANGTVFGEGVGAILLKRLSDAKRDKDNIYGIIKGSAINSGGKTNGFTVPNPKAQADLIAKALTNGNINPRTISYVEAHGTGTSLGDPIEIRGLNMAYKECSKKYNETLDNNYCSLGSIKANIGHSESAAAMSGLIKILLQMKYETIVPTLNSEESNPKINFNTSPFKLQHKAGKWERPVVYENGEASTYPRRAGISSFGAGGSNSHIIIEEYLEEYTNYNIDKKPQLIILSSKNENKLKELAHSLQKFIEENIISDYELKDGKKTITLSQIAYTLQVGRIAMDERVALYVTDLNDLLCKLNKFINNESDKNIYKGNIKNIGTIVKNLYEDENDELLQMLINSGKLYKIAKLWTLGVNIDWSRIHNNKLDRVSLPTYTFEGNKYWIPDMDMNSQFYQVSNSNITVANDEVSQEKIENYYNDNSKVSFYSYKYIESEIANESEIVGNIIIVDTDDEIYNTLSKKISNNSVYLVKPSNQYKNYGNGIYELNIRNKNDFKLLMEDLSSKKLPNNIIYKLDKDNAHNYSIDKKLHTNFCSLLYLSQEIMRKMPKEDINLLYVYNNTEEEIRGDHSPINSFAKTINQENPKFKYKMIEIINNSEMNEEALISKLLKELPYYNKNVEIRYKDNKRFIKTYSVLSDNNKDNEIAIKDKGVYLITGGLGGLGLIFAEYLATQGKVKLILTGRSKLNDSKKEAIKKLESLGSEVMYISADISKKEEVENLISRSKERFNKIDGIIHGAGILKSDFVLNKKIEDINTVFAPKVTGTLLLDEATKDEELEFFVLFSSLSGPMGSVGYLEYATANSFMDYYALIRENLRGKGKRNGVSLAIAWPFWEEGGMRLSEWSVSNLESTIGMIPLKTKDGTKALIDALSMNIPNIVVIQGDTQKGLNAFEYNRILEVASSEEISETSNTDIDDEAVYKATEIFFKKLLSEETKTSIDDIDSKEGLEIYGIDSIMIMSLTTKLEKHFGTLSKTLFFEYQTIEKLAEYFAENYKEKLIDILELLPSKPITKEVNNITESKKVDKKEVEVKTEVKQSSNNLPDIAIIGVSGKYPDADSLDEFWENLKEGKDSVTEIPKDRWDNFIFFDPEKGKEGRIYSKWGAFLRDIDKFDPLFFNISPKEAKIMDPQERLFLQCAWHTFEDAGYSRESISGTSVGVFAGVTWGEYQLYGLQETISGRTISTSSIYASVANRVSYIFNLHGPSIALDTMCASSLTAIHLACESIYNGECNMALAGGVNVSLHPNKYIYLSQGRFAASDGRCRAFGIGGDGYVPGEGVGAVLLKELKQAEADGDQIYGIIKSTSVNHGGKTNGYTVPNPIAQSELIVKAIEKAKVNPRTISYVEAHGTGTALGDPIEMKGLSKAYKKFTNETEYCSIGSSKSNIGHLEAAAGIAGLTKILLQMKYKMLVPSIHTEELNPNIEFTESPFIVQRNLEEWKNPKMIENGTEVEVPRIAAISSFGAGGSNSHIILEEYSKEEEVNIEDNKDVLFILSARNSERLKMYAKCFYDFIEKKESISLNDLAFTLQVGREAMEERIAFTSTDINNLKEKLKEFIEDKEIKDSLYKGNIKKDKDKAKLLSKTEDINSAINNKQLDKLANLWVCGIDVNWKLLYEDNKPKRISLPTYPFAKERYWITEDNNIKINANNKENKLHPLLNYNTSNFREQKFTTVLNANDFYLADHIISGECILPGVAYLEMARVAGEIAGERKIRFIEDTAWIKPIKVKDNKEITISLYPDDTTVNYEVYSMDEEERVIHAQGSLVYEINKGLYTVENTIDLDSIGSRCYDYISKSDYYKKLDEIGFNYGTSFRIVKEIYKNSNEAIAYLELPDSMIQEAKQFILHPSLLDGALHPVISLMNEDAINNDNIYLPFMLGKVEIVKPISQTCYSHVELKESKNSNLRKFDVTIINELGEVLVKVYDFTTKAVNMEEELNEDKILNIFQKLAQGDMDLSKVESIMRRFENE